MILDVLCQIRLDDAIRRLIYFVLIFFRSLPRLLLQTLNAWCRQCIHNLTPHIPKLFMPSKFIISIFTLDWLTSTVSPLDFSNQYGKQLVKANPNKKDKIFTSNRNYRQSPKWFALLNPIPRAIQNAILRSTHDLTNSPNSTMRLTHDLLPTDHILLKSTHDPTPNMGISDTICFRFIIWLSTQYYTS